MSWLFLSALSALFLGLYDLAKKKTVDGSAVLPALFGTTLAGACFTAPVLALSWLAPAAARSLHLYSAPQPLHAHLLIAAKSGIVGLSWLFSYAGLKHLPVTLASPLRATGPFFTVLGAVLLFGEKPSRLQAAGIACILASYLCYSLQALASKRVKARAQANRTHPVAAPEATPRVQWPYMLLMLLAAMTGAVSGGFDKYLLQEQRLPQLFVLSHFLPYLALMLGFVLIVTRFTNKIRVSPPAPGFRFHPMMAAVGGLLVLADLAYFEALSNPGAQLAVVSAIRRSNVLIAFAGGLWLFRESRGKSRIAPLLGIVAGLALLLFSPGS